MGAVAARRRRDPIVKATSHNQKGEVVGLSEVVHAYSPGRLRKKKAMKAMSAMAKAREV